MSESEPSIDIGDINVEMASENFDSSELVRELIYSSIIDRVFKFIDEKVAHE